MPETQAGSKTIRAPLERFRQKGVNWVIIHLPFSVEKLWKTRGIVNKVLLSIAVTSAVYFGSLLPVFSQAREDATFLDKTIETNAAQIELGKLAESKAADPRIKAYAAMLVKDDTKALNRLQRSQDTARSDSTQLSLEHRELRDHLSQLSGPDFDTAYLNEILTPLYFEGGGPGLSAVRVAGGEPIWSA